MGFAQVNCLPAAAVSSFSKPVIVFLNEQRFELGCIVSYMEAAFPETNIIGISNPEEALSLTDQLVKLAVVAFPSRQMGAREHSHRIQQISTQFPGAAIAVATQTTQNCDSLLQATPGLRGIFPTSLPPAVVAAIIRVIMAGGDYFHRDGQGVIGGKSARTPVYAIAAAAPANPTGSQIEVPSSPGVDAPASAPSFTTRETQILQKLAEGLPNKLIAASLAMPENTVKVHIRNIMRKLKSTNRTAAVIAAHRLNVVLRH